MIKIEVIRFRCLPEQKKTFEAKAAAVDMTLSEWFIMVGECAPDERVATKSDKEAPIVATKPKKIVSQKKASKSVVSPKVEMNGRKPFVCRLKGQ